MQLWNGLYLFAVFITLLICVLILSKKDKKQPDIFLFLYILSASIIIGAFYLYFEYSFKQCTLILQYRNQIQMPLLFFYVLSVVRPDRKFQKRLLLLFLPLGLSFLYMGWNFISLPETRFYTIYSFTRVKMPLLLSITKILEFLFEPIILIFLLKEVHQYRLKLRLSYSNLKGMELNWIRVLVYMELFGWILLGSTTFIFSQFFSENITLIFNIATVVSTGMILFIGYFGLRHTHLFTPQTILYKEVLPKDDDKKDERGKGEKYKNSYLTLQLVEEIKITLKQVKHEKLYLNPKLSLADVSEFIGYPAHSISEVLNIHMDTCFYDFVNDMRLEKAKELLTKGSLEIQTILAVALDSGFNSKSTFNRLFKLKTGITPSQFVKQNITEE